MSENRMEGQEPDGFEVQLAKAMRRVDAPEGFAARVMERTAEQGNRVSKSGPPPQRASALAGDPGPGTPKVVTMRPRFASLSGRTWIGGAIAAVLVVGVFGVDQMHVRHEREEQTAMANQQFATAVQVTDHALAQTREQLQRAGLRLGE